VIIVYRDFVDRQHIDVHAFRWRMLKYELVLVIFDLEFLPRVNGTSKRALAETIFCRR
jgi:hypothetical protein